MSPRIYKKYPKFTGLDVHVWDYLNGVGQSIPVIEKRHGRIYSGSKDNQPFKKNPVWHNKTDLDKYVADKLNINPEDYGGTRTKNPFYNAVVSEIRKLRTKKILIDWDKTPTKRGIGIWKLDKQKLETYVEKYVKKEMRNQDFFACGEEHTVHVRQKQIIFRKTLMDQYQRCLFCGFKLEKYLIGAHIVPYWKMRDQEPKNAMNPSNGLLLCRLCDVAFEKYDIQLKKDFGIELSDSLQDSRDKMVSKWVGSIPSQIKIDESIPYKPDVRYLEWKIKLRIV